MAESKQQEERYVVVGHDVRRVAFEGYKCANGHVLAEERLTINSDGKKFCPHCGGDVRPVRLLDREVSKEVVDAFVREGLIPDPDE